MGEVMAMENRKLETKFAVVEELGSLSVAPGRDAELALELDSEFVWEWFRARVSLLGLSQELSEATQRVVEESQERRLAELDDPLFVAAAMVAGRAAAAKFREKSQENLEK